MLGRPHRILSPQELLERVPQARSIAYAAVIVKLESKAAETLPFLHIHVASLSEGPGEADNVSETPDVSQPQLPTLVQLDQ